MNNIEIQSREVEPVVLFISARQAADHIGPSLELIKSETAPSGELTSVGKLKLPLTGVKDSWRKLVRPYLNESEFVEIARKSNAIDEQYPYYGQTIIEYSSQAISRVFSRAYFKLLEILHLGILDSWKHQPIRVACLAEGPGGFLNCLTDLRKNFQDSYYAITLRGTPENISNDWSFERTTSYIKAARQRGSKLCLSYGKTKSGDITDPSNIVYFREVDLEGNKCQLVTADGGVDCYNDDEYTYQELVNCRLQFAEVVTALAIQKPGGCFVMKMYDWEFGLSKQLVAMLSSYYSKVCVVKPRTSRPANSERYLVCEGFFGCSETTLQQMTSILADWNRTETHQLYFMNKQYVHGFLSAGSWEDTPVLKHIDIANKCLAQRQASKLKEGIEFSGKLGEKQLLHELLVARKQQQIEFGRRWCREYDIRHL